MKKKELIVTSIFILVVLFVYGIFPTKNTFQNITVSFFFLLGAPLLYNLFITKKPLKEFGITIGSWKDGVLWSFISLTIALLIFYIALSYFGFSQHYILSETVTQNFWKFLTYEISMVLPFIILYEVFFRGFGMLFVGKGLGYFMIVAQALLFCLFLVFTDSVSWYFAPYILFSFFSGVIAFKSGSLYYSVAAQIFFMIIVDASIIKVLQ